MKFEKKTPIDFLSKKPSLLKMEGFSEKSIVEHLKLYQGYVNKYNEIMEKLLALSEDDLKSGNATFSQIRELKVELTFAIGGVKNHEIYFENLGGKGGKPKGKLLTQIEKDFGSFERWLADFKGTALSARGWVWLVFDRDNKRLFNIIGDSQNTYPIWNSKPLLALDMYEHAYWLDFQTNKTAYIEAFIKNIDWDDVEQKFKEANI
ncbi:MAG: Fe-Mn family superoxide dismutase [Candidatus Aenigmarchaeota archaeon]|nr:Fe-Mn family superoxide dismutase [Candidatus Aenigmarchaeota archaeon]